MCKTNQSKGAQGQAIVLVTLALFAMCGLMGLAVDMGWSFYLEKTEQAAADGASLAAAREALAIGGANGPFDETKPPRIVDVGGSPHSVSIFPATPSPVGCPDIFSPPANNNLEVACLYAKRNGFVQAGKQNVTVELGNTSPPPLVPGVVTDYWATVRIVERVPQLFSAVLGNTEGLVASVSTAAIVDSVVVGSLLLINRNEDMLDIVGSPSTEPGRNLQMDGSATVTVGGGIVIASSANSSDAVTENDLAASIGGTTEVFSTWTAIRNGGEYQESGTAQFSPAPDTTIGDGEMFYDPLRDKVQPPLYEMSGSAPQLPAYAVVGGSLNPAWFSDGDGNGTIPPGIYYDATLNALGQPVATGGQITISGPMRFVNAVGGGSTSGFSKWVFVGGLTNQAAGTDITVAPGQIIMAGAEPGNETLLSLGSNPRLDDRQPFDAKAPNAGEMIILAGPDYPGIEQLINMAAPGNYPVATNLSTVWDGMGYGRSSISSGSTDAARVNLHGINTDDPAIPDYLKTWACGACTSPGPAVVIWQDRGNSLVQYDADGNITCGNEAEGCSNGRPTSDSIKTELFLGANEEFHIYGVSYQPRGSYAYILAGGGHLGSLQLVTGAMRLQGGSDLSLGVLSEPLKRKVVALVR